MRLHAWNLPADRWDRLVRDLSFGYCKWDISVGGRCRILPASLVLTSAEHERIVDLAERFAALLRGVERKVGGDPARLADFGIDPRLAPWMQAESARTGGATPAFGRGDFFRTETGDWMLSEFNEDVPGGFNETVGVAELLDAEILGGCVPGDLRGAIVDAFAACDGIALFYATAFSEDLQHCALLERWLREAGHPTVLASPEHLRSRWGRTTVRGRPVDGAFRFYPGEWMADLPNARHWRRALPRLAMMNPLARLITQSKRSFAHIQADGLIDADSKPLVRAHLPATDCFRTAEAEHYRRDRERLVLKNAFGRMGDAVLLGALAKPAEWDAALAVAGRSPDRFAVQQRFAVQPLDLPQGRFYPTVGAYVVNGRFAGYYSRAAEIPMITHEAYYVATVVADA